MRVFLTDWVVRDMVCSCVPCGSVAMAVCPCARATGPHVSVRMASPLRHVRPGLLAFFCHPSAV